MLAEITALLIIFQLAGAQDTLTCYDSIENKTLTKSLYNDKFFKDISQELELLQMENEMLTQKLDLINFSIQQQLIEQKNAFETNFAESLDKIKQQLNNPNFKSDALPANCAEALEKSGQKHGIHKIQIPNSKSEAFYVHCLTHADDDLDSRIKSGVTKPWLLIQRRSYGGVLFNRNWVDYQQGFGDLDGEFFIGLDKLHYLTQSALHELWIDLEDHTEEEGWAVYDKFAIGNANEGYPINILGSYSGDAGDSLSSQVGQKFSTKDVDNDIEELANCALLYKGGWWYTNCKNSNTTNLNAIYYQSKAVKRNAGGIRWPTFQGVANIKYVHMAIRPIQ